MSGQELGGRDNAFKVFRRFARRPVETEQCGLCSHGVAVDHQHLIEPETGRLVCVCDACAVLFPGRHTKYRRVPRTIRVLPDLTITDAQWDSLRIPIELAFLFKSSHTGRIVALYPSPAGPTESLLPLETWQELVHDNPVLAAMEPDVEAFVANRLGPDRRDARDAGQCEYFILPIDECFKLVGLIRLHWKGLSGGTGVWTEISRFFAAMRARAGRLREVARA